MKIYYKLVTGSRKSAIVGEEFELYYAKGTTVEKIPETVGIMVFNTKQNARDFAKDTMYKFSGYKILKVKGIGKGRKPIRICPYIVAYKLNDFYRYLSQLHIDPFETEISGHFLFGPPLHIDPFETEILGHFLFGPPPRGTVCFDAVEVLE